MGAQTTILSLVWCENVHNPVGKKARKEQPSRPKVSRKKETEVKGEGKKNPENKDRGNEERHRPFWEKLKNLQ